MFRPRRALPVLAIMLLLGLAWAPQVFAGGAPEAAGAEGSGADTPAVVPGVASGDADRAGGSSGAGVSAPGVGAAQGDGDASVGTGSQAGVSAPASRNLEGAEIAVADAVERAVQVSDLLAVGRIDREIAGYGVDEARSRLFPQIALSISGSFLTNPPDGVAIRRGELGFTPSPGSPVPTPFPDQDIVLVEDPENTFYQIQATLDQALFTWGKILAGIEAARLEQDLAGLDLAAQEGTLARDARTAYFGLRLARRTRDLLAEAELVLEQTAADRLSAFDEGLINRETLLSARADLAQARTGRIEAAQGLAAAEVGMQVLLQLEEVGPLVSAPREELPEVEVEALVAEAVDASEEIARAELRRRQAEIGAEVERSSGLFLPDLGLSMAFEVSGQRLPFIAANWIDSWDINLRISLGAQLDLFDGGAAAARTATADARVSQAGRGLEGLLRSTRVEVQSAVEELRVNHARLEEAKARLDYEEERYKNARVSFENDLITRGQERGARVLLLTATFTRELAAFEYERSLSNLEHLVGRRLVDEAAGAGP